jgi:hypothetical protein
MSNDGHHQESTMRNAPLSRRLLGGLSIALGLVTSGAVADAGGRDPVGTWLVDVSFPPGPGVPPPFQEMITFDRDGTVSETNTSLHPGSANPFFNYSGSDGHGVWERRPDGRIAWTVWKFVYCGPFHSGPGLSLGCNAGTVGRHVGYLRIRAISTVSGSTFSQQVADEQVDLLIDFDLSNGTDLASAVPVPFGGADILGRRLGVQLPY